MRFSPEPTWPCPACRKGAMRIKDSRLSHTPGGDLAKRRRRHCTKCGFAVTTYEIDAETYRKTMEPVAAVEQITRIRKILEAAE